jgi:hypothetical protein
MSLYENRLPPFTEQVFSSLEALPVTALIDFPSGAMTQLARAGSD